MTRSGGKVYLVGAGPAGASYLTVRAQQLLAQAEVLIYDALVDEQLLQLAPASTTLFDVGKRGGKPSTPQAEIDWLLVEQCRQGKQVVRLKSGDPFIFGRCTSEIQALIETDCSFEVIPGLSSALAAPLLAGIPLTDPVLSRCFAVLSAHEPAELDWQTLTGIETLVILMGGRQLNEIIYQLQRHGKPQQTPIAIIRWAGHLQQQIWTGTLADILEQTAGKSLPPAVIVIGEVVRLRQFLQLPDMENRQQKTHLNSQQPLAGKTILVTRSAGQSSEVCESLQQVGAQVIEMPAIEIGPPSSWEALDHAISNLKEFDWLILTSTNGVDYFFERLIALKKDIRDLAGLKIAVVGEKTAASLKQRYLQPDFIPPNFVADALVDYFPESVEGKKILFPRVESGGREVLVKAFTGKGANVVEVAAYESRCPAVIASDAWEALQQHSVDVITFASSKTVKYFYQLLGQAGVETHGITYLLGDVCIASIGPQTSKTCKELLGRVDIEAQEYTLEGLCQAIIEAQKT
ncbi:uroporphyrinogen-III C-methyltransferase [Microcoleus sp. FACHB-672]|uniref:uroporphyrinogen-III C-methyltransferase n=1 Tax=Microcoleus sp. FACHB-672 TaxID=2692825 RepID=UPI0016846890|nr:uroporphyrinogen-III C-methyltransferase [Microcoleus sp. FACHB-672]MBD2041168.1 uroporphyrinogen-III C-methyltransferase [Microcoleus sp. FACHB-672]